MQTFKTVNDLTNAQLLKVIERILAKFSKPGKTITKGEFDFLVLVFAHEKEPCNFVTEKTGNPF